MQRGRRYSCVQNSVSPNPRTLNTTEPEPVIVLLVELKKDHIRIGGETTLINGEGCRERVDCVNAMRGGLEDSREVQRSEPSHAVEHSMIIEHGSGHQQDLEHGELPAESSVSTLDAG